MTPSATLWSHAHLAEIRGEENVAKRNDCHESIKRDRVGLHMQRSHYAKH